MTSAFVLNSANGFVVSMHSESFGILHSDFSWVHACFIVCNVALLLWLCRLCVDFVIGLQSVLFFNQ